jgi:hypothetical protein
MATDSFGRLRVCASLNTFDYYPTPLSSTSNLDQDIWITRTNGSGSATFNTQNFIELSVSNTNDYVLRYTKQPMDYEPGKGRQVFMTGVLVNGTVGTNSITSRMGVCNYNENSLPNIVCGLYIETNGTTLYICSKNQVETLKISQTEWNIDKFDGSGPSKQQLSSYNISKIMLLIIDQQWLGVGRVRIGFNIKGVSYYAHQFTHETYACPYTTTPRLRFFYEIGATNLSGTTLSTRQLCCASMIESGFFPLGKKNSIGTSIDGVDLKTAKKPYIILALKLNPTYLNGTIKILGMTLLFSAVNGKISKYQLQLHSSYNSVGSISGTLTYSNLKDSICQYAIGTGDETINTDGYILSSGFTQSNATISSDINDFETLLDRNICTSYDTLYIIGISSTNNETMYATLDFIEDI